MPIYRSARAFATTAIALVVLQLSLNGLAAYACACYLADAPNETLIGLFSNPMVEYASPVMYIAALVFFMRWLHRSIANLTALGSQNLMSPSSAVWAFFIPIVNLSRPHHVLATIWTESQPELLSDGGFALRRKTTVVTAWWVAAVISTIFSRVVIRVLGTPKNAEELHGYLIAAITESALWTVTGIAFIHMVRRSQARQDAQWQDLELRRAAPQPDPNILR